jgi:hypothetical protein
MDNINYKLAENINFYDELYKSLDDNESDTDETKLCQITGLELKERFVTLNCKHVFNYDAIYTEICKQKFEFKTYTSESLSSAELKVWRQRGYDYYIRCPYCRSIQYDLLPYYDDMPYIQKYGVNTTDVEYRVVDKSSHITNNVYNSGNYSYKVYGYIFKKGICQKITVNSAGKNLPCYNSFVSEVVGTDKTYCPCHIRQAAKDYKVALKLKSFEDKQKAKEDKQKAKEDKINALIELKTESKSKLKLKLKTKITNTVISQTTEISEFIPTETIPLCVAILKTGLRTGQECGLKVYSENMCKRHTK